MLPLCAFGSEPVTTSLRDLSEAVAANANTGMHFSVEGEIIGPKVVKDRVLVIRDASNAVIVCNQSCKRLEANLSSGCRVRVTGTTRYNDYGNVCADFNSIEILDRGEPPPVEFERLTPGDLNSGKFDYALATLKCRIRDVFTDDIDPGWLYLLAEDGKDGIYVTIRIDDDRRAYFERLIGCEVEIKGICIPRSEGSRIHLGRTFKVYGIEDFQVLRKAAFDIFHAPVLEDLRNLQPAEVSSLGRRRIVGTVSAVWSGDHVMLHTGSRNGPLVVALADPTHPACGDTVEVVGFPVTDLYRINLRRAKWRPAAHSLPMPDAPVAVRAKDIFTDDEGRSRICARMFGQLLTVSGRILGLPANGNKDHRMYITSDGFILAVDISACPDLATRLSPDSQVEVTGICVMETENWQTDSAFPSIKDVFLAVRRNSDIRITVRPPWWTTGRLLAVISSLLSVLVAVLAWNTSLRRLAERRGRALFRTEIDKASAELKTHERTRLAIELHDQLSQMLSGVSMQIDTVRKFFDSNREKTLHHLDIASKTLLACRENLRDCLWDLRNRALEEPDMSAAVRATLEPHVENATISVRFNVPRERLSDNAAHAILSIVRELTVNAIRHGKATTIRIAGCLENGKILFSVTDDGCGFDPDTALGMSQGHFGLQGIRERVEGFEGEMSISSASGSGTKVSIALRLPQEDTEESKNG